MRTYATSSVLLSFLSASLLILSFPPFDLEWTAWFALVPLFVVIREKSLKTAFSCSILTGLIFFMGVGPWIKTAPSFEWGDFLLAGVYLSLYFGLFGLAFRFISRTEQFPSFIVAPVFWVSLEYLRAHTGFLSAPWALLGHSQYLNLPIIQIASLAGVYGISFLIVMANAFLSEMIARNLRTQLKPAIAIVTVLGLSWGYGWIVLTSESTTPKKTLTLTVIQGNIPPETKWNPAFERQNLEQHLRLTREAAQSEKASLIIWPEASVQGSLQQNLGLFRSLTLLARESDSSLLVGNVSHPKYGQREFRKIHWYNSALVVTPDGKMPKAYHKVRLLPFAEYLPYGESFPFWPSRWTAHAGHFIPGNQYAVFALSDSRFGVLICWEAIFPDLVRRFVLNGAEFLVNITNEGWFGETAAPYQFMAISVFRAVENRRTVVRAANTGISCFIDPYGRIMGKVKDHHNDKDIFVAGFLTREISLSHDRTVYTLYGDLFVYFNLTTSIALLILSLSCRRKAVPKEGADETP